MSRKQPTPVPPDAVKPLPPPTPPAFTDALATQTKDVLTAVDRRNRAHDIDQSINRREHLDVIKTLLNEHRSDVLSDVAALMAAQKEKETVCPSSQKTTA